MQGKDLRIVYMGTPDFAVAPMRLLVERGYNVIAVVTVPDKPAGRGLKVRESAVKQYAAGQGIKVLQPEKLKDPQWLEEFAALKPDLAIVVAFRMLPEVVWSLPPMGTFNLHASLLPAYRGAAPINWAIMNGEHKTGVTTFFLDSEIDKGAIIDQKEVAITTDDTAGTLHDKLMDTGAELVVTTVDNIASGKAVPKEQPSRDGQDGDLPAAPKIFREDCKIDWNRDAKTIYDKIRGLSPYPAAWCDFEGTTAKIFKARYETGVNVAHPGSIETDSKSRLSISCPDGRIFIEELQLAGKKPMTIAEYLRGRRQ